jgi:hypothetical protein
LVLSGKESFFADPILVGVRETLVARQCRRKSPALPGPGEGH